MASDAQKDEWSNLWFHVKHDAKGQRGRIRLHVASVDRLVSLRVSLDSVKQASCGHSIPHMSTFCTLPCPNSQSGSI